MQKKATGAGMSAIPPIFNMVCPAFRTDTNVHTRLTSSSHVAGSFALCGIKLHTVGVGQSFVRLWFTVIIQGSSL
ncbi:MAG TPA: hypothetical protein VGE97_04670 [Nitrososphaera sp.]